MRNIALNPDWQLMNEAGWGSGHKTRWTWSSHDHDGFANDITVSLQLADWFRGGALLRSVGRDVSYMYNGLLLQT